MHPKKIRHLSDILINRGIDCFIHVTPIENLESILEHGILPVAECERRNIDVGYIPDLKRLDGNREATCFSVQDPNFDHFKRIQDTGGAAVLIVSVDLILDFSCSFYPHNASKSEYKYPPKGWNRKTWQQRSEWFEEMFTDDGSRKMRDGSPFPTNWTTDMDAEVQAFGNIPTDYIDKVAIDNVEHLKFFQAHYPDIEFTGFLPEWE